MTMPPALQSSFQRHYCPPLFLARQLLATATNPTSSASIPTRCSDPEIIQSTEYLLLPIIHHPASLLPPSLLSCFLAPHLPSPFHPLSPPAHLPPFSPFKQTPPKRTICIPHLSTVPNTTHQPALQIQSSSNPARTNEIPLADSTPLHSTPLAASAKEKGLACSALRAGCPTGRMICLGAVSMLPWRWWVSNCLTFAIPLLRRRAQVVAVGSIHRIP